jgi:hypothetical protein
MKFPSDGTVNLNNSLLCLTFHKWSVRKLAVSYRNTQVKQGLGNRDSIPNSLLLMTIIPTGGHRASYSVGTGTIFLCVKRLVVTLAAYLHPVPWWRMHGAIYPLSHTLSLCGVYCPLEWCFLGFKSVIFQYRANTLITCETMLTNRRWASWHLSCIPGQGIANEGRGYSERIATWRRYRYIKYCEVLKCEHLSLWGSVSENFDNRRPLHRRSVHIRTTFVKLRTPKVHASE